jgi:hypothetical protein
VTPYIDPEELKAGLAASLRTDPVLLAEVDELFYRDGAPFRLNDMPKYVFRIGEIPLSDGAVGLGLLKRSPEERRSWRSEGSTK